MLGIGWTGKGKGEGGGWGRGGEGILGGEQIQGSPAWAIKGMPSEEASEALNGSVHFTHHIRNLQECLNAG
jgi:hypothetical protein